MLFTRLPLMAVLVFLGGCEPSGKVAKTAPPRPVRTITVGGPPPAASEVFAGRIEARDSVELGFRIAGRLSERLVGVGARVRPGQVLARLDKELETNDLRSARALLVAAESAERQASAQFGRTAQLAGRGIVSQAEFEAAEQALEAARSQREAAAARVRIAQDVVGFTQLEADAEGVVTWVGAEPGEVVAAGRPLLRLVRKEGRDAVIDVPGPALEALGGEGFARVRLSADATIEASGRVRELSPEADPVTRLFRVRIGITEPPGAMSLGASVQVAMAPSGARGFVLPASALVPGVAPPAVLVVNVAMSKVARRPVELGSSGPDAVSVIHGLEPGEVVVTAGTSTLSDGQAVRLAGGPP